MIYCIDPNAEIPIMLITKHIGFDSEEGMGVDGSIFQRELLELDTLGKKKIEVWINSPGGIVTDGYSIYSGILKTVTPVDTVCIGTAASISGVIFQAGRKRIMADYSWLMYHNPFGGGNNATINTMKESIVKMIASRCGMTEEAVGLMMNRNTYILADEAKNLNLCDEVRYSEDENTKYLRKISNSENFYKECNKVLNLNINSNNSKPIEMIKVTMKLGLNDSAPEDSIVKAIEAIENRVKIAEAEAETAKAELSEVQNKATSEADKLKAKIKQLEEDKTKNDAELEDCKAKLTAIEKDKAKAEEDAKADKAKNMIEDFAKIGRIKNEEAVKLQWTKTALVVGLEEAKNMIEALPINKVANTITEAEAGKLPEGALPTTAMGMAVKARLKREGKLV